VAIPVLFDCDPGYDDAVALMLALASPELEVLGVSAVAGNEPLEHTTANAIRVLELLGRDEIPVAAGAARPLIRPGRRGAGSGESRMNALGVPPARGTPVACHAVDFLAERIEASPEPPWLVAIGPLTNVALLLALRPRAAARIAGISIMGGAIGDGNVNSNAEFNVWFDPHAAERVFSSGVPCAMFGLDVTRKAVLAAADAERLRALGPLGEIVEMLFHFEEGEAVSWPIHDAVAVMHLARPGSVETMRAHVTVECASELTLGRTVVDGRHLDESRPIADVGVGLEPQTFADFVFERLPTLVS
jgi:pyrimidine-specific ribonucleoside hydrolase